jgi:hypothetical protein
LNEQQRDRAGKGVDGGGVEAYKRGPSEAGCFGGLLIEIVETREGMRGRRPRAALMFARRASVLEALVWVDLAEKRGSTWDELESLILAQNERWRHA